MANQYAADALKRAQGLSTSPSSSKSPVPSASSMTPQNAPPSGSQTPASPPNTSVSASSGSGTPSSNTPSSAGSVTLSSNTPASSESGTSSGVYKQLLSSSYQQTLQAMQNVKANTEALEGKKLSLGAYKASILQAQATFSSAEAFVQANPPTEDKLNPSYQELLAGISLAKDSMDVVLNGVSALSPASFYAAREMGRQAQHQVIDAFAHF